MRLTRNFDSSEFDIHEPFPAQFAANRAALASLAQYVRDIAGSRGDVTSAYRSPEHNSEVHGASSSQHMRGEAIDIYFPFASLRRIATQVLADIKGGVAPEFGQIIFYADKGHIHLSLPTLGNRNGEVRFSFVADETRLYPFLTLATVSQLPTISEAQARQGGGLMTALALIIGGAALLMSCATAKAQTMVGVAPDNAVPIGTMIGGLNTGLVSVILYLVREMRSDLRDMKDKVAVLWDKHEHERGA